MAGLFPKQKAATPPRVGARRVVRLDLRNAPSAMEQLAASWGPPTAPSALKQKGRPAICWPAP